MTAKVYVRIRLGRLERPVIAQLDTGAAWSLISPDLAAAAGVAVQAGDPATMSTRVGVSKGVLVNVPLVLLAEEGESLDTEGTFFVPSHWPADLAFLGYSGLLSKIRFAVDPEANDFYFGPSAGRL